jgi:DNA end-binding protein Ku
VAVPVKAYPAVSSSESVHFNQLHADCGQRIRYEKRCPQHGPVEATAIVRGFPYAPDQYVIVEAEELEKLRPARDKALVLEHFVASQQIDPTFFAGRSLYLAPDGMAAQHPYAALAGALAESQKWALARVVLSGQRQLVVVRAAGCVLIMDVLHYPAQVRSAAWGTQLAGSAATPEERRLAGQLIDAASGPLDWSRYRDTTTADLTALIEAKIAKRAVTAATDEPVAVLQFLAALQQSVAAVRAPAPAVPGATPKARRGRRAAG